MGRVVAPFGIKGWIKVQVFTEEVGSLLDFPDWQIGREGEWTQHQLLEGAVHGKVILARLAGFDLPETVAALRGKDIAVPRAALPPSGDAEFYWTDLVGMTVVNREGLTFGRVAKVFDNGAHSVLAVEAEGSSTGTGILIPFVAAYIDGVDTAEGKIRVDWQPDF